MFRAGWRWRMLDFRIPMDPKSFLAPTIKLSPNKFLAPFWQKIFWRHVVCKHFLAQTIFWRHVVNKKLVPRCAKIWWRQKTFWQMYNLNQKGVVCSGRYIVDGCWILGCRWTSFWGFLVVQASEHLHLTFLSYTWNSHHMATEKIDLLSHRNLYFRPPVCPTLKRPKVPRDSSNFDENWTDGIAMTWTFISALLRKLHQKKVPESHRPTANIFRIPPAENFLNPAGQLIAEKTNDRPSELRKNVVANYSDIALFRCRFFGPYDCL